MFRDTKEKDIHEREIKAQLTAVAGLSVETTQKDNQTGTKATVKDLCWNEAKRRKDFSSLL